MLKFDLVNKEHCYILGYLWADCYFGYDKNNRMQFSFEIKENDFITIWPLIQSIGFKTYKTHVRNNSNNRLARIRCSRQKELEIFSNYNFHKKNDGCPLYFSLPSELQPYFIKGFLDGDGSISFDKNNLFRIVFYGNKLQNWDFMEDFCNKASIKYVIYLKERPPYHKSHTRSHNYSVFEFTDLQNRINLCSILEKYNIGSKRKIEIYTRFKEYRANLQLNNKLCKQFIIPE
jgi:hypothetical protein